MGNAVAVALSYSREAFPLREVLPQQAVEVLVAAPLPRAVRVGEVAANASGVFECLVAVELGAVIHVMVLKGSPLLPMSFSVARFTAVTVRCRSFSTSARPELRSTRVSRQSRSPAAPMTVSPSQWPASCRDSTTPGRVSIMGLPCSRPRFSGPDVRLRRRLPPCLRWR